MRAVTLYALNEHPDGSGRWWHTSSGWASSIRGCISTNLAELQDIQYAQATDPYAALDLYIIRFVPTDVVMTVPAPGMRAKFVTDNDLTARLRARRGDPPLVRLPVPKASNRYSNLATFTPSSGNKCNDCDKQAITGLAGIGRWCKEHFEQYAERAKARHGYPKRRAVPECSECRHEAHINIPGVGRWCEEHWDQFKAARFKKTGHICGVCHQTITMNAACGCFPDGLLGSP